MSATNFIPNQRDYFNSKRFKAKFTFYGLHIIIFIFYVLESAVGIVSLKQNGVFKLIGVTYANDDIFIDGHLVR